MIHNTWILSHSYLLSKYMLFMFIDGIDNESSDVSEDDDQVNDPDFSAEPDDNVAVLNEDDTIPELDADELEADVNNDMQEPPAVSNATIIFKCLICQCLISTGTQNSIN